MARAARRSTAKQFEQWTNELSAVLSERYGFDSKQIKVLTEKPADATTGRATAEEVKRTFASVKVTVRRQQYPFRFSDWSRIV